METVLSCKKLVCEGRLGDKIGTGLSLQLKLKNRFFFDKVHSFFFDSVVVGQSSWPIYQN